MQIFIETKELVTKEKKYTALILEKLLIIEKQKLFAKLKYPSLFKYLCKELGYTEAEANLRVAAVRLMQKDKRVSSKIAKGELSLTNASEIQKNFKDKPLPMILKAVDAAKDQSTRSFKKVLQEEFQVQASTSEKVILDERILAKMERVKKEYGDISSYELIDILLEEKLKTPKMPVRPRSYVAKVSRSIPLQVKAKVYTGRCAHCGDRRNLEYDHIQAFSKRGSNHHSNIQLLCRNCNQYKGAK